MTEMMKRLAAATAILAAAGLAGSAFAQGPEAHHVTAAKLAEMSAKIKDGLSTNLVPTGPNATVMIVARDKDGEVEVHDKLSDEIIARKGNASIRVGGKVEGNHVTAPNEHRGGKTTGGTVYKLAPGDVIFIPAGMPHQMLVPKGTRFDYMAIKFPG